MSITYSIVCDDCQERAWIGQGNYFYSYKYIPEFFHRHIGHKLCFINDHADDELRGDYYEFEGKE